MRRHPDHHSRTLLAQFGLTPKSKRGLAASEVVLRWMRCDRLAKDQPG